MESYYELVQQGWRVNSYSTTSMGGAWNYTVNYCFFFEQEG
jgi:hypothetical protein